jgi:hypothetical protein
MHAVDVHALTIFRTHNEVDGLELYALFSEGVYKLLLILDKFPK